jgi:hypothetical protein
MGDPYGAAGPSHAEGVAGVAQVGYPSSRARPGQGGVTWHMHGKK